MSDLPGFPDGWPSSGSESESEGESGAPWKVRRTQSAAQRAQRLIAVRQQRVAAVAAVLVGAQSQQGPQGAKRKDTSPFVWEDHVARLTEAEFKLRSG